MRLAVIIRSEQKEGLPTAAELRRAGFAVSTALRPDGAPGGTACEAGFETDGRGGRDGSAPERAGPERAGPARLRLPQRQRP